MGSWQVEVHRGQIPKLKKDNIIYNYLELYQCWTMMAKILIRIILNDTEILIHWFENVFIEPIKHNDAELRL